MALLAATGAGCRSAAYHARAADERATRLVESYRRDAAGRDEPFSVEPPADPLHRQLVEEQGLPTAAAPGVAAPGDAAPGGAASEGALPLGLLDALKIGTRHSRAYQDAKEAVFRTALALDLEQDGFRRSLAGTVSGAFSDDRSGEEPVRGASGEGEATLSRTFRGGASVVTRLAVDVVKLLTMDKDSALGLLADATVTVPLLRGAGAEVFAEPLTQAERNLVYAVYDFERFRRRFAVGLASDYLSVLERRKQIVNAEESYGRLRLSTERAARMAAAGRLPEIQVDQSRQDELRARERLVQARLAYQRELDDLKVSLGLPADARVTLDDGELARLASVLGGPPGGAEEGGHPDPVPPPLPFEDADAAVRLALAGRLDLRKAAGAAADAERGVRVARDNLRAGVKLVASGSAGEARALGSADRPDARLRPAEGVYSARLEVDLPWERTEEQVRYREALLNAERARRELDAREDAVKQEVREAFRAIEQARESYVIQYRAVAVARRRAESAELFLQAGRAQIRDLLEAEEALVSAENAVTSALVAYRSALWRLQRDMEVLGITEEGLWDE